VKIDLPYAWTQTVKGRSYTYYRRDGQRIPIKGVPGTREWLDAYYRIHESFEAPAAQGTKPGSLGALVEHFLSAPEFTKLANKTKGDYRTHLDYLKSKHGQLPVATMPRDFVLGLRDKMAKTPRKADYLVAVLKRLLNFAIDRPTTYRLTHNPAAKIKSIASTEGWAPWEEWQIAKFRAHWKPDTVERVAFEMLLNLGQRGGDTCAMVRNQYFNGSVAVKQEKTRARVWVPASDELADVLDAWLAKHDHIAILTLDSGAAMKIHYFRKMMAAAFQAAGIEGVVIHGLRYTAATVLHEVGCDWETIGSITGHATAQMVKKYTEKKRRAKLAIARLNRARGTKQKRSSEKPD